MTPEQEKFLELGKFWATVSEEHNVDKFATILAPDFVMWYNFDDAERTREQFMETLRNAHAMFHNQVNANPRITVTTDGFIVQATLQGDLDGKRISAPYCLIAKVRDGLVVRGDEYFDTSHLPRRPSKGGTEFVVNE
jgi:ketosteroid isomerase-like protein